MMPLFVLLLTVALFALTFWSLKKDTREQDEIADIIRRRRSHD